MTKVNSDLITHFHAVKLRVVGEGDLLLRLISMSATHQFVARPLTMELATNRLRQRLTNFKQEFAQLEIKTTEIDEHFVIEKIFIYTKPIYGSYPSLNG